MLNPTGQPYVSAMSTPIKNTEESVQALYEKYLIANEVAALEPIEVVSASGTQITASDGSRYLDCFSGISVVNAGRNPLRLVSNIDFTFLVACARIGHAGHSLDLAAVPIPRRPSKFQSCLLLVLIRTNLSSIVEQKVGGDGDSKAKILECGGRG